jgi:uncharacterized protein YqjF (DUF2071 family)
MDVQVDDAGRVAYHSHRTAPGSPPADFVGRYRAAGPAFEALPGSLEYFLTERYCLYNVDDRYRAYRLDIHHLPWRLQRAEAEIELNTMTTAAGIALPSIAPLVHFSARQDMVAWAPATLESLNATGTADSAS